MNKLNRITLTSLTLIMMTTSVMAEWIPVAENARHTMTVYVDTSTIRTKSNKVKMWILKDYKDIQSMAGIKFLSTINQHEYDCKEEQIQMLASTAFENNMGAGKVVATTSIPYTPRPIAPDSVDKIQWEMACR